MQQFLLPDQTPPILEAEMALRAEQQMNNVKQQRSGSAQSDGQSSSQRLITSPDPSNGSKSRQEVTPEPQKLQDKTPEKKRKEEVEKKRKTIEDVQQVKKKEDGMEARLEPEGRQADTTITENNRKEVCLLNE